MQANAVVAVAPNRIQFQAVTVLEPTDDDVVVRLTWSWISPGTEGSFVRGERIAGDTPRSTTDPLPFPHAPGYQKCGIVEWIGANVTHVKVGDRVFATVSAISNQFFDYGGHISPSVVRKGQVWKLPDLVSDEAASGLVLAQVGVNIGTCAPVSVGDRVVVIGDGLVGHWAAQTLQWRGANVLMTGRHDNRLSRFTKRGFDKTVNLKDENLVSTVGDWSKSLSLIADTVGDVATMESLYRFLKRGAALVSAGFYGENGRIDIQKLRDKELCLYAPSGWTTPRIETTLALLSQGHIETLPLITHRFPAESAADAFAIILNKSEPFLGVLLDWRHL